MDLFETVKANVSVPDAAKRYGIVANRHGMARCLFHDDRIPGLKLNQDYYYCFGCGVHGETVCLLSKFSEAKSHISVKVEMDEIDLTAAESKATYAEIRNWVQENYGFRVTNLNIAQVKRKHGIIERENYNKPKSEDSRHPGCPEEKEKAIEEALKHFQMIE